MSTPSLPNLPFPPKSSGRPDVLARKKYLTAVNDLAVQRFLAGDVQGSWEFAQPFFAFEDECPHLAELHAAHLLQQGKPEQALDCIALALAQGFEHAAALRADPTYASLHSHPRWLKLFQEWDESGFIEKGYRVDLETLAAPDLPPLLKAFGLLLRKTPRGAFGYFGSASARSLPGEEHAAGHGEGAGVPPAVRPSTHTVPHTQRGSADMVEHEAMQVWADELEQEGDARAALLQELLAGRDGAEVIAANWGEWVGRLDPKAVLCRWEGAQLTELSIGAAPEGWTPGELGERPTTEGIARLALGPGVSSQAAGVLPALRHLVCLGGRLDPLLLRGIDTLTIAVRPGATEGLARLFSAPRLDTLHSGCVAGVEVSFARALGRARWFPQLREWTHRPATAAGVEALLSVQELVAREGEGLTLLCEQPVLNAFPARALDLLPRTRVTRLPTPRAPAEGDRHGPVQLHVVPRQAPMNFRDLPPRTDTKRRSMQSDTPAVTSVGSGFELPYAFTSCGWCGSANTRCIWSHSWELYSHFETTRYLDWEYECADCGLFNSMQEVHTS